MWCVAWQCKKRRFVLVFTVFGGHRPFYKKQKIQNTIVKMRGVFLEACRHHFFIDFSRFWPPFWEGFGRQNPKIHISEGFEKTVKKRKLRVTPKFMRAVQARGGSPNNPSIGVPRPPPELPRPSQERLTHYEHTTTCLEARWRILWN